MHQRKILLLENVATQAAGVREHLSQVGYQVTVSRYEADGLKRLVEWGPDLVLVSTAHPAGDFVEYCRRLRALAPTVRIIVTASLNGDRLFQQHPGLQPLVDGVLLRPYSHEEVAAMLASGPASPVARPVEPIAEIPNRELRSEFQRQLDAKFLEIEELKRHLGVATRRLAEAPGQAELKSENEQLRRNVAAAQQQVALALATEQLKRSELEVQLDNLLRMKKDFEFRAQNEIEDRTRELEVAGGQLQELRGRFDQAAAEHEALRIELERSLIDKEQIEERLHGLESSGIDQVALAAEGQVALADLAVKAVVLEESLAREQAAREAAQRRTAEQQERRAELEKELAAVREAGAGAEGTVSELRERLTAAETAAAAAQGALLEQQERRAELEKELAVVREAGVGTEETASELRERLTAAETAAAGTRDDLGAASERRVVLEKLLVDVREARAEDARLAQERANELVGQKQQLLERAEDFERRNELLQSSCTELEERLRASEAARVSVATEAESVVEQIGERATALAAELERERAAGAAAQQRASDLDVRLAAAEPLAAEAAVLRARAEDLEGQIERLIASGTETLSDAAARDVERLGRELAAAGDRARELAAERDRLQALLEERRLAFDGEVSAWREKDAGAAREFELFRSQQEQRTGLHEEELRRHAERLEKAVLNFEESESRVAALRGELAAERERLTGMLEERERVLAGEVRTWRESAEAAALEIRQLQKQEAERATREADEQQAIAERRERDGRELAERELQIAALRESLAAAEEARRREVQELEARVREEAAASREASGRLEIADAALVAAREGFAARAREARLELEAQQAATRELEERLAAGTVPAAGASPMQAELHRIQELLEEVIARARTEAVDYARRDVELSVRLQSALDERRLLQERFDRANAEATERERRSSALLQSAIDHRSSVPAERANLPAVVPLENGPGAPRRLRIWVGLAVVALVVIFAVLGLRRTTPPAVLELQPAAPQLQPGAAPGAAVTPREVWERWTRSDGSGNVLVQATLRSRQELRAEVEADSAPGRSEAELQAELAQRLSAFRFDSTYYMRVYLKNLAPGYPAYFDDLPGRFRLRDSSGKEVPAFLPPGHEKDRRIFSFGAGGPTELIYEASVPLAFDRAGLSPAPGYLQLVVSDVGTASRRVLTWELE